MWQIHVRFFNVVYFVSIYLFILKYFELWVMRAVKPNSVQQVAPVVCGAEVLPHIFGLRPINKSGVCFLLAAHKFLTGVVTVPRCFYFALFWKKKKKSIFLWKHLGLSCVHGSLVKHKKYFNILITPVSRQNQSQPGAAISANEGAFAEVT